MDALRRLAERQCLCRDHRATEPVGQGPILVSVDKSGSMQGEKVEAAKALALTLAWLARQQRRWCGLVAYSGSTGERLLALPPTRWDEGALAGRLEAFLGRGSSLDVPVAELPDYYRRLAYPQGATDMVLIEAVASGLGALIEEHRQAIASFGQDTREGTLAWAAERVRLVRHELGAYSEYLAEERARLELDLAGATRELRDKVEKLASPSEAAPA